MKTYLLAAIALLATPALAVPVSCPGTPETTDREFAVDVAIGTGAATCFATGTGNLIGSNADFPGWTFIEKDGINNTTGALSLTGIDSTSGLFTIDPSNWGLFGELLLGFKSGQGILDPDWAAFYLSPAVLAGSWTISGQQALSHANLYGRERPFCVGTLSPEGVCVRDVDPVPEPGSLALMGMGLLGLGTWLRKKQA